MKKIKNKFLQWVIRKTFVNEFSSFVYPYVDADQEIRKMNDDEKAKYFEMAETILNSKLFEIEMRSCVRTFYRDIALKTNNDIGIAGYRLSLLFIRSFERRLMALVGANNKQAIIKKVMNE